MDDFDIKPVLETLLFVSDSPVRLETLVEILPEASKEAILEGIRRIQEDYQDRSRGIELVEIAGGYQFRTKMEWAEWVSRLKKAKAVKLSQAALETLAIIAYRQPVIRPAVEDIRGVDSGSVIHTLLEKGLIKLMGRKDLPGRPMVYGTTKNFLEIFGLNAISDLPSLKEIEPPPSPEEVSREEILKTEPSEGTPQADDPQEKESAHASAGEGEAKQDVPEKSALENVPQPDLPSERESSDTSSEEDEIKQSAAGSSPPENAPQTDALQEKEVMDTSLEESEVNQSVSEKSASGEVVDAPPVVQHDPIEITESAPSEEVRKLD